MPLSLGHAVTLRHCAEGSSGQSKVTVDVSLSLSPASSLCQEVLLWFLEKSERETSLSVLEGCAGLEGSVRRLHPQCCFRVGSEGGAVVAVEEPIR